jgi:hypothetical protein
MLQGRIVYRENGENSRENGENSRENGENEENEEIHVILDKIIVMIRRESILDVIAVFFTVPAPLNTTPSEWKS